MMRSKTKLLHDSLSVKRPLPAGKRYDAIRAAADLRQSADSVSRDAFSPSAAESRFRQLTRAIPSTIWSS